MHNKPATESLHLSLYLFLLIFEGKKNRTVHNYFNNINLNIFSVIRNQCFSVKKNEISCIYHGQDNCLKFTTLYLIYVSMYVNNSLGRKQHLIDSQWPNAQVHSSHIVVVPGSTPGSSIALTQFGTPGDISVVLCISCIKTVCHHMYERINQIKLYM